MCIRDSNYVDEEGNNILTSGIKLDENATYFNTSILTDVPYGWEIANVGDVPEMCIRDRL